MATLVGQDKEKMEGLILPGRWMAWMTFPASLASVLTKTFDSLYKGCGVRWWSLLNKRRLKVETCEGSHQTRGTERCGMHLPLDLALCHS